MPSSKNGLNQDYIMVDTGKTVSYLDSRGNLVTRHKWVHVPVTSDDKLRREMCRVALTEARVRRTGGANVSR